MKTILEITRKASLLVLAMAVAAPLAVAQEAAYLDPRKPLEERVEDALGRLTLEEKVGLLSGGSSFGTRGVERLGIPALNVADGPNGLRSNSGEPTTAFPVGVVMAATWNPELVEEAGAAMGREALAKDVQVLLGPNVNIVRTPLAGRNFETYSEDPVLAREIGIGFVNGVQSEGVGTSPKHYVANNQEFERLRGSSNVSERVLREIYMPAFEGIVKEAEPWTIMAAYNRVNGVYATDSKFLMTDVLKDQWGFDGVVLSDWGAVHSTVDALKAGTDLEMPGPGRFRNEALVAAANSWQVEPQEVDEAARRMLRLILRTGVLDGKDLPDGELNSDRTQEIARRVAEEGIVLLKNDDAVLPLQRDAIERLAVIGPNADVALIGGGGSSQVTPYHTVTALEGIRALVGDDIEILHEQGVDNEPFAPTANARYFSPTQDREETGLTLTYYTGENFTGDVISSETDSNFFKWAFSGVAADMQSMTMSGYFFPPVDGQYEFSLVDIVPMTLAIDGEVIIDAETEAEESPVLEFMPVHLRRSSVSLEGGRAYKVEISGSGGGAGRAVMRLGLRLPEGSIDRAVELARDADAAVLFVGVSTTSETEGKDRESMGLYGRQNELVDAVLAANPNTVIVLHNGAPLALPWADKAKAIVEAWLPGQEGGDAIARVLFGEVNPSGKLPVSFPRRIEDNPSFLHYPGTRDAFYGEGVFVGYRYYDTKKIAPLFPFGHGLSYTSFSYEDLEAEVDEDGVTVSLEVANNGERQGGEVVQLYVRDVRSSEVRPYKELKAFEKVDLRAGRSDDLSFQLSARDFSFFDVHAGGWRCEPGEFEILVGSSSRDIRQTVSVTLDESLCAETIAP